MNAPNPNEVREHAIKWMMARRAQEDAINKLMIKRSFWCGVGFLVFGLLPLAWVALKVMTDQ